MYPLIIKIITAHLLGDFVLQSDKMVDDIHRKKLKSKYLYLHSFIHFLLILIVTGFAKKYILAAFILSNVHLIIDIFTKIYLSIKLKDITKLIVYQSLYIVFILTHSILKLYLVKKFNCYFYQ